MTNHSQPRYHRAKTLLSTKQPQIFRDEEFGDISYRRITNSRYVRIRMHTNGRFQATLPLFAPVSSLKKLIDNSREQLRKINTTARGETYVDGQKIGHSHTLHLVPNRGRVFKRSISGQKIIVSYPSDLTSENPEVQATMREHVAKALRKESKAYLPRRLRYLADHGGFDYKKVRFAHQSGRWGSCSSSGTISLNIALMNLPFEMIDYVLVHELAHTRQMNHSPQFWAVVEEFCPDYKNIRKALKSRNPYL